MSEIVEVVSLLALMSKTVLVIVKILLVAILVVLNVFIATSCAGFLQIQLLKLGLPKYAAFGLSDIFAIAILIYIIFYYRIHNFLFKENKYEQYD